MKMETVQCKGNMYLLPNCAWCHLEILPGHPDSENSDKSHTFLEDLVVGEYTYHQREEILEMAEIRPSSFQVLNHTCSSQQCL